MVAAYLVEVAVEGDHFAVEAVECTEAEVAVLFEFAGGDDAVVDAFHEGGGCGDLEECGVVEFEGVGQGGGDDVCEWFAGALAAGAERLHEGFGDFAVEGWHGVAWAIGGCGVRPRRVAGCEPGDRDRRSRLYRVLGNRLLLPVLGDFAGGAGC